MAVKGRARKLKQARKKAAKLAAMDKAGGKSRYARKHAYCVRNGVWGFEVPEPKPWK